MMIAISIFAISTLFLYQTFATLQKESVHFQQRVTELQKLQQLQKLLYLDIALAWDITIRHESKNFDQLFFKTTHSLHNNGACFVSYIVKDSELFRLESPQEYSYPFGSDLIGIVDPLGEFQQFRLYNQKDTNSSQYYLLHAIPQKSYEILYKIKRLNNY